MINALIEIGLEEVPARFIDNCLRDLKNLIKKEMTDHRLITEETEIITLGTFRRFTFIVNNIKHKQDDLNELVFGPPVSIAKIDGDLTKAGIGFAKKFNVSENDLSISKNDKGQEVIAFKQNEKGQLSQNLLPVIIQSAIKNMKLPIAMKWGSGLGPFIRPIQWLCCLTDQGVIDVEIFGIKSSNKSYGHRFLSNQNTDSFLGSSFVVKSPNTYVDQLRDHFVIVSVDERKEIIKNELLEFLSEDDIDGALLNEVTHLVESPTALKISFPEDFLSLPEEVLIQCLKKHQKAFLLKSNDSFTNACIVIADSIHSKNKESVINGNQKVMLARLNDVQFFWDEDIKNNGFSNWNSKLEKVIFQDGLGSIAEKVERISHICHTICDQLNIDKKIRDNIDRAAHRCKSDLVSNMVQELPALQGIMGGYYSIYFKESPEVANAIKEHYQPRFEGDGLPQNLKGVILSIADRLDTIVACFENNNIPTGSRDPWGIRRSMLAIVRMMIENNLNLNLELLIEDATLTLGKKISDNTSECLSFFKKRIETVVLELGIPHDFVQLFDSTLGKQPLSMVNQARLLMKLKEDDVDQYQLLIETTVRVSKIIKVETNQKSTVTSDLFLKPIEKEAFQKFQELKLGNSFFFIDHFNLNNTIAFCKLLTIYFDDVLINAEDPKIANNRRSFIQDVNKYFQSAGDWLKLTR